jgi:hypothetical protein
MVDREMYDAGDGGASAIVAGLLVVVLVVIGFFFFLTMGPSSPVIDVTPKATLSAAPAGQ